MKKEIVLTILIAVMPACVGYGVLQAQVRNNTIAIEKVEQSTQKAIDDLSERQNKSDVLLNSINNNLASLNTKMDLLLSGKLKQGDNK